MGQHEDLQIVQGAPTEESSKPIEMVCCARVMVRAWPRSDNDCEMATTR